jgi:cobyrinic acid a,c-diamide synthase
MWKMYLCYCEAAFSGDRVLGAAGGSARGHVFHWAGLEDVPEEAERALIVSKGNETIREGFSYKNVLGSWVHLHFASNPDMAEEFVKKAAQFKRNRSDL